MKYFYMLITLTFFNMPSVFAKEESSIFSFFTEPKDSLYHNRHKTSFSKRETPVLNVALVSYGSDLTKDDLNRITPKIIDGFYKATDGEISLNIQHIDSFSLKNRNLKDFKVGSISDEERLKRIWYYKNGSDQLITEEVYKATKDSISKDELKKIDLLLVASGAQFEGLGFNYGRFVIVESPWEVAFELEDGGKVEHLSDETLVDEFIHELGHAIGMNHAAECTGLNCCDNMKSANDVMSYCRDRRKVNEGEFFGFEECHMSYIRNIFLPILKNGGEAKFKNAPNCK